METALSKDGLLPAAPAKDQEWLRHIPTGVDDSIQSILRTVADVRQLSHIVWPARLDGRLKCPPDAHVLDAIVREYLIEGADEAIRNEALDRPEPMTVAVLSGAPPQCSSCASDRARYDTSQRAPASGWAMLCGDCYALFGIERLGAGLGQYLLTWSEIGLRVRSAYQVAAAYWVERGVLAPDPLPWCQ